MSTEGLERRTYDAIVVGARCAGAAAAMLLARSGMRVLAVDRAPYGSDTLSTHALMRGGVLQLARWGVLEAVRAAGATPVRTTAFHYGDEILALPIKARDGVDALYAPRRSVLDRILVDAARESGAEVRHGVRLTDLLHDRDRRVRGVVLHDERGDTVEIEAGIVIGADGVHSSVARLAGAREYRRGKHATAVIFGYWSGFGREGYHWHFRPGVAAGSIPTTGGQTCVFVSLPPERYERERRDGLVPVYHQLLRENDAELAAAVAGAHLDAKLRTFAGQVGHVRQSWGPGWALVGDAGYFKDPLTAHGMTDALRDVELLARAVASGTDSALEEYQATRDDLSARFFDITDRVASFQWDLPELQQLHLGMSEEMKREVEHLLQLSAEDSLAA